MLLPVRVSFSPLRLIVETFAVEALVAIRLWLPKGYGCHKAVLP
jgi:hypothetical protein